MSIKLINSRNWDIMKVWHRRKRLKCSLKCSNLNLEGLNDMAKQDIYTWPEAEDDNLDELLKKARERNKNKTVEELDAEWDEFVNSLKLETI